MQITINGDGSIIGLAVGGLPDGSVDTDTLASGAITSSVLPAGTVIQTLQGTFTGTNNTTGTGLVDTGVTKSITCLLYTSPSPRDGLLSRMPSSA